jgi:hypothetical protein
VQNKIVDLLDELVSLVELLLKLLVFERFEEGIVFVFNA